MPIIRRLEEALMCWEDHCSLSKLLILAEQKGRLSRADEAFLDRGERFREYLLQFRGGAIDEAYVQPQRALGYLDSLPVWLLHWTKSSRQSYQLTADAQHEIASQPELDVLRWDDIVWPFASYAIELATPLPLGDVSYDTVLITDVVMGTTLKGNIHFSIPQYQISLFGAGYVPLRASERAELERLARRKDWRQLRNRARKAYDAMELIPHHLTRIPKEAIGPIQVTATRAELMRIMGEVLERRCREAGVRADIRPDPDLISRPEAAEALWGQVARIIAGLNLVIAGSGSGYERSSVPARTAAPDAERGSAAMDVIDDARLVCAVTRITRLGGAPATAEPPSGEPAVAEPGKERDGPRASPDPHPRRKHKRRRPGSGPKARKTVPVKSTVVREAFIPPGTVLGGQKKRVRKKRPT